MRTSKNAVKAKFGGPAFFEVVYKEGAGNARKEHSEAQIDASGEHTRRWSETRRRSGGDPQAVKQERPRGPRDEGEDDSRNEEGSVFGMGSGLASARGVRGRMRAGFRPGPAGGEEESREQSSAGPESCEAKGRGQKATGDQEGGRQKARAKEEGRRSGAEGKRFAEGRNRAAEEDKRPRAEGTGAADKPTEEGAKGAGEEGGDPRAAGPEGEVNIRLVQKRTRESRENEAGTTIA